MGKTNFDVEKEKIAPRMLAKLLHYEIEVPGICDKCAYADDDNACCENKCIQGITEWLKQEATDV
jgi:hypothetical protein